MEGEVGDNTAWKCDLSDVGLIVSIHYYESFISTFSDVYLFWNVAGVAFAFY